MCISWEKKKENVICFFLLSTWKSVCRTKGFFPQFKKKCWPYRYM